MSTLRANGGDGVAPKYSSGDIFLFWACFIALIATAFGFIVRTQIMDDWKLEYHLTETQKGELFGVGLWPFAISIVLFSLVIDRIGYGKAMAFAFFCHVASAVVTIATPMLSGGDSRKAYWILYAGTFLCALGNGTVEAVINPVVATIFSREKTKWLNMLHAGWPGGLVVGGIFAISMGSMNWKYKVALLFLPVLAYGILMIGKKFPINERVAAGVSYLDMLKQVGFFGAFIVMFMIMSEVGRVTGMGMVAQWIAIGLLSIAFGAYTKSLGQPLLILLMLIMIPLATTELGTDSWISDLMKPEVPAGINSGWVLVYTSLIMMILRFFAGPIVHKLSPLGLLALSSLVAAGGLIFLSVSAGLTILLAATLYGFGKTFFWPTMLGLTAEQFPKGGALTLNAVAAVGMLAVGVLGNPFFGKVQDSFIQESVEKDLSSDVYAKIVGLEQVSVFGKYKAIDADKLAEQPKPVQDKVALIQNEVKKKTLKTVALFPCLMFVCYVGLMLYYKTKGGYKPQILIGDREEELLMTGGAVGPAEL